MSCQEGLSKFREASTAYEQALTHANDLKRKRDQALLAARDTCGMTVRALAEETGLSHPRVQQILERARRDHEALNEELRRQTRGLRGS